MSRLAIALALALAATTASAQTAPSGQSQAPAAPSTNEKPFLFDGRMKGDGIRREAQVDKRHPNAGAIIVQPKESQPERK